MYACQVALNDASEVMRRLSVLNRETDVSEARRRRIDEHFPKEVKNLARCVERLADAAGVNVRLHDVA